MCAWGMEGRDRYEGGVKGGEMVCFLKLREGSTGAWRGGEASAVWRQVGHGCGVLQRDTYDELQACGE